MFPIWSSEFTEIVSTRPNLYNCTSIMTGGIVEAIQPLVMKGRTDCDPFMRYSISDLTTVYGGMFGGGSRPFGRYWYLTDQAPDPYLLLPADREEVKNSSSAGTHHCPPICLITCDARVTIRSSIPGTWDGTVFSLSAWSFSTD